MSEEEKTPEAEIKKIFLRFKNSLTIIGTTENLEDFKEFPIQTEKGAQLISTFKLNNDHVKDSYFAVINYTKTKNMVVLPITEVFIGIPYMKDFDYDAFQDSNLINFSSKILEQIMYDAASEENYENAAIIRNILTERKEKDSK